jgi:sugar phosphate isomerase/epimerase
MRLGGPIFGTWESPEQWAALVHDHGYSTARCPLDETADEATIAAFARAAAAADIVFGEVGAWSNPLSTDHTIANAAITLCQQRLALADAIGATCCVNIAGSRGEQWDGPHPDNLTTDTFALIVDNVRTIIDAVQPKRTYYTLEPMPWAYPDSVDSYLELIKAIDRSAFAVHLDPVNMIANPRLFYQNSELLRDCFARLGPYIKACHAKDITLSGKLTVHLSEMRPGTGSLDFATYLRELHKLDTDVPLLLEHLPGQEEYIPAAQHLRAVAQQIGVVFR